MHTVVLVQLSALIHSIRRYERRVAACPRYGDIPGSLRHLAGPPGAPILLRVHQLETAVRQYFVRSEGIAVRIDEMYRQGVLQDTCLRILVRQSSILFVLRVKLVEYLQGYKLFCQCHTRA